MRLNVLFLTFSCFVFGQDDFRLSNVRRRKRGAAGALDIVTNNAQPIHAEVKPENVEVVAKECSQSRRKHVPSKIEPGVVFQVTPPTAAIFEPKSLRKSSPLSSRLDLVRGISRIITLSVLAISAVFEFYPIVRKIYDTVVEFLYNT